ncbi:MAG: hypothetical protein ACRETM_04360 [Stenotrophobium sp.]
MITKPARRPFSVQALTACGIAAVVTVALSLLCADLVREYFPYAEEWKILLPSLPQFAHPLQWFRGFAYQMSDPYPAWAVASVNFLRPVMNLTYWLRGALFGDAWGAELYFNFLYAGVAVGALYLCLRTLRDERTERDDSVGAGWAGLLLLAFLCMPSMICEASRFMGIMLPQMAFDRLLAAFCLLACLAYGYRRYVLATALLAIALLTKEHAAPVAIALPLTYAWAQRRQWRTSWPTLLLLALPIVAWLATRLLLFGSVAQGVYVLMRGPAEIAHAFAGNLIKLPLFLDSISVALHQPLSLHGLLLVCNTVLLAYLAWDTGKRWRAQGVEVISLAAIGTWCFLGLVGLNPRYGTLIEGLVVLMLARPAAPGVPAILRIAGLVAFMAGGAALGLLSLRAYDTHVAFSKVIYQVGRDYAVALGKAQTGMVVVLNDPNTMYTAPSDMAKVLGLPVTTVYKVSDFPWQWPEPEARVIPQQPCSVSVSVNAPGTVRFEQSCGLQIMGALVPNKKPLILPLAPGIDAEFPDATLSATGGLPALGNIALLHVRKPGVSVLFFDPATRTFHWLSLGGATAPVAEAGR